MNPQSDQTPGLHLPEPSLTTAGPMVPVAPPQPSLPSQPQTIQAQSQVTPPAVPQYQQQPAASGTPATDISQTSVTEATELDAEQQWIDKAKSVVEQFQMDPYAQSNALSKIKADYLKTQHNITTKLGDQS